MKKNLFLIVILTVAFFSLNISAAAATIVTSTSTAVAWPDYHVKPWVLNKQIPMAATVSHKLKNNDLVLGEGKYDVRIGTISYYFDATDPDKATMAVMEGDVLGNGPSVRRMFLVDVGAIDFQINVNGKWKSVPPGCSVKFSVIDEDLVISKNIMTGVVVTVADDEGKVVMQVVFKNKDKKK